MPVNKYLFALTFQRFFGYNLQNNQVTKKYVRNMGFEELASAALKLDFHQRGKLAGALLESLHDLPKEENERLWAEEIERRRQECLSGQVKMIPAEEVLGKARSLLS